MLTEIFVVALVLTSAVRLWLATRHRSHVAAHRGEVPLAFRDAIPLEAHQKAADYTVARAGLARADVIIGALWLAVLTLGGGLLIFVAALAVSGKAWQRADAGVTTPPAELSVVLPVLHRESSPRR